MFTNCIFKAFTEAFGVGYNYVCLLLFRGRCDVALLAGTVVNVHRIWIETVFNFHPVKSHMGYLHFRSTSFKCFCSCWFRIYNLGSIVEYADHTVLVRNGMVTISLQILISVSGLINSGG